MYLYALEAIQKPIESSPNLSKDRAKQKAVREIQKIYQPIGKRAQKIREKVQPIDKRNQSAFLGKSNKNSKAMHKNFKNGIIKGQFKKFSLTSGGTSNPGLFDHVTFRPI